MPAVNVNKVCLSGLNAIYLADQMIAAGEADIVVAGGMESMTNAPYLADGARGGFRYGNTELRDAIIADGLWCAFDACLMGLGTERYTAGDDQPRGAGRARRDVARAGRRRRSRTAARRRDRPGVDPPAQGRADRRRARRGRPPGTTVESLGGLRPAFDKDGTITAGNASQLSDGASAVVRDVEAGGRAARRRAARRVRRPTAWSPGRTRRRCCTSRAARSARPSTGPASALGDIDLFEINEAFAAVGLASMADLGISADVVNVNGGAIALGHPIGMSGNRLALTLLHELRRRGGGTGAAALCGGGGQGDALSSLARLTTS